MLATAGLVLGAILGTSSAAARFGAGALVASGAIGAGCMIGSALVRNAGCRSHAREDEESSPSAELVGFLAVQPIVVEPESVEHEESQSGYVEWLREKRRESAKTGREI
ncbi:MAG TPA: hypothetical protein VHY09_01390 [Candidatus Methylacidiphilales bacterium]|nr:hypothetical protein [Candidatus Methylacidiphilales bacterium]